MINYFSLVLFFFFSTSFKGYSQTTDEDVNIPFLSLKLDSIKWGTRDSDLIYYSLTNYSNDTIIYTSNSCPSYNLFTLTIKDSTFLINNDINCSFNSVKYHVMLPNETISVYEYISMQYDGKYDGIENVMLTIPYVLIKNTILRLSFYENDNLVLEYHGLTLFSKQTLSQNKIKKNNKY